MTRTSPATHPSVTVIVPIRNEAGFIQRSLQAILDQDYPSERMDVLVADGMSSDNTRQVIWQLVEQRRSTGPCPEVAVIDNPGGIVATGMNAALKRARGEIIVRVDGHTIIFYDYVSQCVAALERTGADNVGGTMDPVSDGSFGKAVALATSSPFGVGGGRFHYSNREEWVDTVYMGAWRRDTFRRIGFFDEELVRNQDDEFNYRLLSHGGRILLSQQIKAHYHNRSTFGSLWRQYFQYGYWKVRVMQKHPRQMRFRQLVPPTFVLSLLVGILLSPLSSSAARGLLAVVAAYALVNAGATVWMAAMQGPGNLAWLPVVFTTLHLSYGMGFVVGLVKFLGRWRGGEPKRSGGVKR